MSNTIVYLYNKKIILGVKLSERVRIQRNEQKLFKEQSSPIHENVLTKVNTSKNWALIVILFQ